MDEKELKFEAQKLKEEFFGEPEKPPVDETAEKTPCGEESAPVKVNIKEFDDNEPQLDLQPEKKQKKGNVKTILTVSLVVFSVLASFLIIGVLRDVKGFFKPGGAVVFVVEKGDGVGTIAKKLKDKDIISSTLLFQIYIKYKGHTPNFQYGEFKLDKGMTYQQIIDNLEEITAKRDAVSIVIPEGYTITQIANTLDKEGVCRRFDFIQYLNTAELNYDFVKEIPKNELRYRRLEGYMFPDSYEFFKDSEPAVVAKKFLDRFQSKISKEFIQKFKNINMTLDEALTLASIIEKEAGDAEQMPYVASVFLNRLAKSSEYPRLQSDVTYLYRRSEFGDSKNIKQEMLDAYDTYECKGLPVGPVCNPSINALNSILNSKQTNFYYFVSDINGELYFSETFAEHQRNVSMASKIGAIHGTDTD